MSNVNETQHTQPYWTREEFQQFEKLVLQGESKNQMQRIESRLGFRKFIAEHGEPKCDAMFKALCERDSKK